MESFEKYVLKVFFIPKREEAIMQKEYRREIDGLTDNPRKREIGLLIPEEDENYFRRVNPVFAKMKIQNGSNKKLARKRRRGGSK